MLFCARLPILANARDDATAANEKAGEGLGGASHVLYADDAHAGLH